MYTWSARPQPRFGDSVLKLLGHVIGGAIMCVGLAAISWALGWWIESMQGVHPFNPSVLTLLHGVEIGILYIDIALSAIVLLVGGFRFIGEIAKPRT